MTISRDGIGRRRAATAVVRWQPTPDSAEGIDTLLAAARQLQIRELRVLRAGGRTVVSGVARYALDRDMFFERIKALDGWERDVVVELTVERLDIRGYHTVQPGETLASIAGRYLGSEGRELDILDANRDRMNDPEQVSPGQQLLIPRR